MLFLVSHSVAWCNGEWIVTFNSFFKGAGGGIVSMALTYPLVSISSRLQVQKNDASKDAYKVNHTYNAYLDFM